jgi:outer membrane protein OmpA-like peptidoglycan-associated protein
MPVLLATVVGGSAACATKGFVNRQVAEVNGKVESLSTSVEETQDRTRRNEGAINEVGQRTQAAQGAADQARQAASAADQAAKNADSRAAAAGQRAEAVDAKADELDKASKRLVYTVVLNDEEGKFNFGKSNLPDEARAKLDELVNQIKADPKGAYFEIEGHTDNIGNKDFNEHLGLERAEAVKRYLYEQHQIPLHKMNVISYGMEKPAASNKTKEGRAQNRRVVIRVLV